MLDWVCPREPHDQAKRAAKSRQLKQSTAACSRKILDVGSGLGTAAMLLRDRGTAVIAVDISHSRLVAMRAAAEAMPSQSPRAQTVHSHDHSSAAISGKIFAVKARAEALPFRPGALDGACSRAVLIHTDIPRACDEIARALRPGAPVAFSEVMAHNPLVRFYRRTLAPREWQSITTYFSDREVSTVTAKFDQSRAMRFYELGFLAFLFQFAIPARAPFRAALKLLTAIDNNIARIWPGYHRFAWFVLIRGKNRQP